METSHSRLIGPGCQCTLFRHSSHRSPSPSPRYLVTKLPVEYSRFFAYRILVLLVHPECSDLSIAATPLWSTSASYKPVQFSHFSSLSMEPHASTWWSASSPQDRKLLIQRPISLAEHYRSSGCLTLYCISPSLSTGVELEPGNILYHVPADQPVQSIDLTLADEWRTAVAVLIGGDRAKNDATCRLVSGTVCPDGPSKMSVTTRGANSPCIIEPPAELGDFQKFCTVKVCALSGRAVVLQSGNVYIMDLVRHPKKSGSTPDLK